MGVILNRPSAIAVSEAVPPLAALVGAGDVVYVGGPVQPQAIVVLGDFVEVERAATIVVGSIGFLPGEIEGPEDVPGLTRARVYAGYAGWGAGQLESELDESAWIVVQAEPGDVFANEPPALWSAVLRRQGGPFAVLASMPPDPSAN